MSNLDYHTLVDISTRGRVNDWHKKKTDTMRVGYSLYKSGFKSRSAALYNCGTQLIFSEEFSGRLRLHSANFCKDRMCPMCTWRRSLKLFGQTSKLMDYVQLQGSYRFLFLTLTIKNCSSDDLRSSINSLIKGFSLFLDRKIIKNAVLGAVRHIEVTFNSNSYSNSFKTFHPHIHAVLMVKPSYFARNYIKQDELQLLWQSCLKADYEPIVHIENVSSKEQEQAVAELSKYPVKMNNILEIRDESLFDFAISSLAYSMANVRLIEYYGLLRKFRQKLKLDDIENGDLVNTDYDVLRPDLTGVIYKYKWVNGLYILVDDFN